MLTLGRDEIDVNISGIPLIPSSGSLQSRKNLYVDCKFMRIYASGIPGIPELFLNYSKQISVLIWKHKIAVTT